MGRNVYDEVIAVLSPIERIITDDELCFQVELEIENSYMGDVSIAIIKTISRDEAEQYKVGYKYNYERVM